MTSTEAKSKRELTRADILAIADYGKIRRERRQSTSELKKRRRVEVGPFATFYFENYETMWQQVHEMLYVEKGGDAQIADEDQVHVLLESRTRKQAGILYGDARVALYRGVLFVLDGHHAVMAARLRGDKTIGVNLVDLDHLDRSSFGSAGEAVAA